MHVTALVAFVVGVCCLQLQRDLPSTPWLLSAAGAGLIVAGAALFALQASRKLRVVMVGLAAAVAGFVYAAAMSAARLDDALAFSDEGKDITIEGVVSSLPARLERGLRFEFDVERVLTPNVHVPPRVLLGWYGDALPLRPAERWQFTVRLKRPHGVQNPGGFDLEAWLLERNLRATGSVRTPRQLIAPRRIDPTVNAPGYLIERARHEVRERVGPSVESKRYDGVIMALVVGDQRSIGAADWTLFNRTGISHLVSISGLHITMIAALAGWCAAAFWRRTPILLSRAPAQTAGIVAGLIAACLYALLAGWGIPAQRTVLMLAVVAIAWIARARVGLATSLAAAAAAVCVVDPWAVLSAGFWLSFGAVAAIVWVMEGRLPRADWPGWRRALVAGVRVQIAVTLALVPATVLLFHQISLVSPFANAVAIPVVSWLVTPLALVAATIALLPAPLDWPAELLMSATHAVFSWLADALTWAAAAPASALAIASPPALVTALGVFGIAWLLAPPGWPARVLGALIALPMFVWPAERPPVGELWATAIDIGQGSAVLIEARDRAWLFDTGPRYSTDSDAGERIILPYLRHRGVGALDGLVVSHLDSDHSGGTAAVLRGIRVKRVLTSIAPGDPVLGGRAVERCQAGEKWDDADLRFEMLHPTADDYERHRSTNAMSCTLLARVGSRAVLLTGDIGVFEEAAIVARWRSLPVDWMAAPHHGSRSSSSDALLAAVNARYAVAQAGYRNRYGHPDAGVVARYEAHGIDLRRTDQDGALQWRFAADGTVRITQWRGEAKRYWHDPRVPAQPSEELPEEPVEPASIEPFIAG